MPWPSRELKLIPMMKKNPKVEVTIHSGADVIRVKTAVNKIDETFDFYTAAAVSQALTSITTFNRENPKEPSRGVVGSFGYQEKKRNIQVNLV